MKLGAIWGKKGNIENGVVLRNMSEKQKCKTKAFEKGFSDLNLSGRIVFFKWVKEARVQFIGLNVVSSNATGEQKKSGVREREMKIAGKMQLRRQRTLFCRK